MANGIAVRLAGDWPRENRPEASLSTAFSAYHGRAINCRASGLSHSSVTAAQSPHSGGQRQRRVAPRQRPLPHRQRWRRLGRRRVRQLREVEGTRRARGVSTRHQTRPRAGKYKWGTSPPPIKLRLRRVCVLFCIVKMSRLSILSSYLRGACHILAALHRPLFSTPRGSLTLQSPFSPHTLRDLLSGFWIRPELVLVLVWCWYGIGIGIFHGPSRFHQTTSRVASACPSNGLPDYGLPLERITTCVCVSTTPAYRDNRTPGPATRQRSEKRDTPADSANTRVVSRRLMCGPSQRRLERIIGLP